MTELNKMLIIEDQEDVSEPLVEYFKLLGVEVHLAKDGEEALEILEKTTIDLIVSDVEMPGMNGIDFIKTARKNEVITKAIMMTGNHGNLIMTQVLDLFSQNLISGFIFKPFKQPDLKKIIDSL